MNERILSPQLLKLAQAAGPGYSLTDPKWVKKFAELIVRECAQVVENKTSAPGYGVAESWCEPKDLFEHFGVE